MKLIDEIIDILSSENGKLSEALVKTKVLLHQIGHKELVSWVNNELNGYPDKNTVPEYRVFPAQVLVNATNMAYQVTSQPIPLGHLEKEQREMLETARMDQSLAVLEQFAENENNLLRADLPVESYGILGKGLQKSYHIQRAWTEIGTSCVIQILTQVRSRLLDFLLELRDQFPSELDDEEVKQRIDAIDTGSLFNNAIFGSNTTILLGNSNVQSVSNVNAIGNFEILTSTLKSNGVSDEDIAALKVAIEDDSDEIDLDAREFGPEVKRWLQDMLSKAVEASWNIELGVASSLLAMALNNFYGWF